MAEDLQGNFGGIAAECADVLLDPPQGLALWIAVLSSALSQCFAICGWQEELTVLEPEVRDARLLDFLPSQEAEG